MTARRITGALFIDMGEGREIKHGDRAGQIVYKRQPRARYECLTCRTVEGPVEGPAVVARFAAEIRTTHALNCTATSTTARAA